MKNLSLLIKPASSLCNLRCVYCFYADVSGRREVPSYGMMSRETARGILCSVRADLSPGDRLTVAFQGGEPTLAGIGFFREFFRMADEILQGIQIRYSFQTNGFLLDDEWCRLFREHRVLVGLSLDGPAGTHNAQRPDASGRGSYNRVHASLDLLRRHGVEFNVLTVLTAECARHPAAIWNWLVREKIRFVQFIPCLDELEAQSPAPYALTPSRFRDFYCRLFPLWKQGMEKGQVVSVKLFDDLVNLYAAGSATACGITGACGVQYVVEANGDVFPCDFYVLDRYRMGSLLESTPGELRSAAETFLSEGRAYAAQQPCQSCPYRISCGGGCKRMKDSIYLEDGICHYAELLDEILEPLLNFARSWLSGQ